MGQQIMGRPAAAARPHKVKGFWFLVRRVPTEFAPFDRRNPVRVSTGIRVVDDPRGISAREIVERLDRDLARYWNVSGVPFRGDRCRAHRRGHVAGRSGRQERVRARSVRRVGALIQRQCFAWLTRSLVHQVVLTASVFQAVSAFVSPKSSLDTVVWQLRRLKG